MLFVYILHLFSSFFLCNFVSVLLRLSFLLEQHVQCVAHPVFIHTCCHIISSFLHLVPGIAHGYADAGLSDDGDVVATIAKSHRLFHLKSFVGCHGYQRFAFVGFDIRDVSESWVPAGTDAIGQPFHYFFLLCLVKERTYLKYGLFHDDLQGRKVEVEVQTLAELLCQGLGIVDNGYMLSPDNDCRLVPSVGCIDDLLYRCLVNLMAIEPVFSNNTQCTGRRDVPVDEVLYLS